MATELPYQVNKAALVEKIAELVKAGKIDGIAGLQDESDRDGMRMVVECKKDAAPRKVLNNLFKHTPLKLAFSANIVALVDGQPQTLPLKAILQHHIDWRREVIRRRTEFDLQKARDRAHILEGLKIALDNLDAVIRTIRESADVDDRAPQPHRSLRASRRSRPTPSSRCSCGASRRSSARRSRTSTWPIIQLIAELEDILANPRRVLGIIKDENEELAEKYGGPRRTRIEGSADKELSDEDLIADEDVVITVSTRGYIKRQPLVTYRRQARGGKGIIGARTVEEDAVAHLLVANTHDWALFFTDRGRVFSSKVHAIPDASRQAKGMPIINLEGVQVESGERVLAVITLPDFEKGHNLVMATVSAASSRRRPWSSSSASARPASAPSPSPRTTPWPGSRSRPATTTSCSPPHWALARFREDEVRPMGRDAAGVIGIRLARQRRPGRGHERDQRPASTSWCSRRPATASASRSTDFRSKHRGGQGVGSSRSRAARPAGGRRRAGRRDRRGAAAHQRSGGQVVRTDVQVRQPLRQRRPWRHRHAPQRG